MDGWIASLPLEGIGLGGLVVSIGLIISRGWWVPARTVVELTKMRDDRIKELAAERDDWKARGDAQTETLAELMRQNTELLELARAGNALMTGLMKASGKDPF